MTHSYAIRLSIDRKKIDLARFGIPIQYGGVR
jgi:hypothetical protein